MAEGSATRSSRGHRSLCLPVSEGAYSQAVRDPAKFRRLLDGGFRSTPELFAPIFARGYELKDGRMSVKLDFGHWEAFSAPRTFRRRNFGASNTTALSQTT